MRLSILKKTLFPGFLGLAVLVSQGWQGTFLIELDPRLDQATVNSIVELPLRHEELSLLPPLTLVSPIPEAPAAHLKISLEQPPKAYSSGIYRQTYLQVIAPFESLLPPLPLQEDQFACPPGQRIYTADALAYARYHDLLLATFYKCPGLNGLMIVQMSAAAKLF